MIRVVLPYHLTTFAPVVGDLVTALGHDRVDVLGYSWGGELAQQLAVARPAQVRRLVLVATTTGALSVPASPRVLSRFSGGLSTFLFEKNALSLAEDVVAVALAALLFFQPLFTVIVLVAILILLLTHGSRVLHALSVLFFRIAHPRRRLPIDD